jgi:hypothetical protein
MLKVKIKINKIEICFINFLKTNMAALQNRLENKIMQDVIIELQPNETLPQLLNFWFTCGCKVQVCKHYNDIFNICKMEATKMVKYYSEFAYFPKSNESMTLIVTGKVVLDLLTKTKQMREKNVKKTCLSIPIKYKYVEIENNDIELKNEQPQQSSLEQSNK